MDKLLWQIFLTNPMRWGPDLVKTLLALNVGTEQQCVLLDINQNDWVMLRDGSTLHISMSTATRAYYLNGILAHLIAYETDIFQFAQLWLHSPSRHVLFAGHSPLGYLMSGGLDAFRGTYVHVQERM